MRRPLTVRWWFRVALIVVVLIGGYVTAYLLLRDWDATDGVGVGVAYPDAQRYYAASDVGKFIAGLYAGIDRFEPVSSGFGHERMERQLEAPGVEFATEYSQVYLAAGGGWRATACRAFYLAERVELWVRGIDVVDGEFMVVDD